MKLHPESFKNTIQKQNKFLNNAHVILIRSLSPEIVFHIKDQILSTPQTYDMIPTHKTAFGEYRVIVDKTAFKSKN